MLDGSRYAGAPEVVFNTGQGWGSYWTPLHTVSPVVSPSVTTSAAQTKRTLDVEMFGTADNQVLLTEVDLTGVCSPIAQPVVENCSDPLRETLVAPASGQFFWNFGWHNQHWTGSLRLPFVITDKQFAVVGGNTSRVVSSKTDTGVWSISAVRTTRGWNVTSSWSTDAHGSHTTHLSASLAPGGELASSSS